MLEPHNPETVPELSIVIVNWNTGELLRRCVTSISQCCLVGFHLREVVVVDNASTDLSLSGVEGSGLPIKVIRNVSNKGFGAACNQGAAVAKGRYLLFLNPDTRLFRDSLFPPLQFLEHAENQDVGIAGIQLVDESGAPCLSYAPFPSLSRFLLRAVGLADQVVSSNRKAEDSNAPFFVDQVIGAFFVIRRSLFQTLGGFDERFFVYYEEADLAFRARKSGWRSVCVPIARCIHFEGGSSRKVKAARLFYSLRSRILYGFKHFSLFSAICLVFVTFSVELAGRLSLSLARRSFKELSYVVRGYAALLVDMPFVLKTGVLGRLEGKDNYDDGTR